jgi:hypothetical protein
LEERTNLNACSEPNGKSAKSAKRLAEELKHVTHI